MAIYYSGDLEKIDHRPFEELLQKNSERGRNRVRSLFGNPDGFKGIVSRIVNSLDRCAEELCKFDVVGFSNSYAQLFFSGYIANIIKKKNKNIVIIFGGSEVNYVTAESIRKSFGFVDYFVVGEGEIPIYSCIEKKFRGSSIFFDRLVNNGSIIINEECASSEIQGDLFEFNGFIREDDVNLRGQLRELDKLPYINYDAYFEAVAGTGISAEVFKSLIPLVETGRGCYWSRPISDGRGMSGCAFCGEKNLWVNYRKKRAERVASEVLEVVRNNKIPIIYLCDSAISFPYGEKIFDSLSCDLKDTSFVMNIRADTPSKILSKYRKSNVTHLTVGFEALSNIILGIMNKGTTVIQNIAVLKYCEELDIRHDGVLICYHPGVPAEGIEETFQNIEFARYYRPLSSSRFHLLSTSPISAEPWRYNLDEVNNHEQYKPFMPSHEFEKLQLYRKSYIDKADREIVELWEKVESGTKWWIHQYNILKQFSELPLIYQHDGPGFLRVTRRDLFDRDGEGRSTETEFVFDGWKKTTYLSAYDPVEVAAIKKKVFSEGAGGEDVDNFLDRLVAERLAYREGDRILALAVPIAGRAEMRFFDFGD